MFLDSFIESINLVFGQNIVSGRDLFVFMYYYGGWMILFYVLFRMSMEMYQIRRFGVFIGRFEWQFLAIDIPKENEQSPLAVENIFAHLAGAHMTRDLREIYWDGQFQQWFSFEIISIEGYIQFVIMTEKLFRDLVESIIYAQYPDAEITEIEDYTTDFPTKFPDPVWKVWGCEFELVDSHYIPIKTHMEFEDKLSQEFKDPMAALLETYSRIGKDEQAWFQIILFPTGQSWKEGGFEMAREMLGKATKKKAGPLFKIFFFPIYLMQLAIHGLIGEGDPPAFDAGDSEPDKPDFNTGIWSMTPGEVDKVKAIERKVSKIGWMVKVRNLYIAKHEVFDKSRIVYGVVGAIKQFTKEDTNGLKPAYKRTGTSAHYVFMETRKDSRRTKIMSAYKGRSAWLGVEKFILNVEELASLWHFPVNTVRAPLLQKTVGKRGEAPMGLPSGDTLAPVGGSRPGSGKVATTALADQPLPYADEPFDMSESSDTPVDTGEEVVQSTEEPTEPVDDTPPENLPFV